MLTCLSVVSALPGVVLGPAPGATAADPVDVVCSTVQALGCRTCYRDILATLAGRITGGRDDG